MHTQQRYKQLVFYVEACESGSMFDKLLPTDINGRIIECIQYSYCIILYMIQMGEHSCNSL